MEASGCRLLLLGALLGAACADTSHTRSLPRHPDGRAPAGPIVVLLAAGSTLPSIACDGPWEALGDDGQQRARSGRLPAGSPTEIAASDVRFGGRSLGPPPIELRALGSAWLAVDGKPYRGSLWLELGAGRAARIINRVSVEDYLLGVVPAEMPARFGLQALKAQAVAARSFALAAASDQAWLYPDTRSQMYGGVRSETPLAVRAVRETRGQVLTGGDGPLLAWYHSTCGGRTAPARLVFAAAPLHAMDREVVCSDCRDSPMFSWRRRIAAERVCSAIGLPFGPLDMVGVGPDPLPGRPARLFVRSGVHSATLPMSAFRERISAGMPLEEQVPSTCLETAPRVEGGDLVLEGHGWGHGVGMCQYGAAGFAARGADYRSILRRYYPGAELMRLP